MTLVVAVIDRTTGEVSLSADTKLWKGDDEALTRKVYTEPLLKIVLLSEDLAVGYAGAGPDVLAAAVTRLHGLPVDDLLEGLTRIAGGTFVVARRDPAQIWSVSAEGGIEERTAIGRAWAGDKSAYEAFQAHFDDFTDGTERFRLQSTMQHIVHLVRPDTVGGYVILASGSPRTPFRYLPVPTSLASERSEATIVEPTANPDGTINFTLRFTFAEAPMVLSTVPGVAPTPGALGLYLENAAVGYLYPQQAPAERFKIKADTLDEFVRLAQADYGQSISRTGQA